MVKDIRKMKWKHPEAYRNAKLVIPLAIIMFFVNLLLTAGNLVAAAISFAVIVALGIFGPILYFKLKAKKGKKTADMHPYATVAAMILSLIFSQIIAIIMLGAIGASAYARTK